MARSNGRRNTRSSESPQSGVAPASRTAIPWSIGLFLVLLAVYLAWFFQIEFGAGVPRWKALTLLLVPDEVVANWFGNGTAPIGVVDRLPLVMMAGGIIAVGISLGRLCMTQLDRASRLVPLERFVFATAIGLNLVSTMTLAIGLIGGLQLRWPYIAIGAVALAAALWQWGDQRLQQRRVRDQDDAPRPLTTLPTRHGWWLIGMLPFAAVLVLGALLPPIDFDVLEYHLQVPKEWFLGGRIGFMPHNIYGNMPMGAEVLTLPAMSLFGGTLDWWRGALVGKLIIACFALLTSMALYAAGRRYFSRWAGGVAALVYLSTTWVTDVSVNGLVDGVLACYTFCAFYALRLWWDERKSPTGAQVGLLLLTGWLAGGALACKYTGAVFVAVPIAAVVMTMGHRRGTLVTLVVAAMVFGGGLWYAKNWALSGNPTYPLLYRVFDGQTRTPEKDRQWRQAHQVPHDADGQQYSLRQAWQSIRQIGGASRWSHPLLVPLLVCLIGCWRRRRRWMYWGAVSGYLLLMWWLVTHRIDRFWLPALPPLALLAGVAADWTADIAWRRTVAGLFVVLLPFCFLVNTSLVGDQRYFVELEALRTNPVMSRVPVAHRYLNTHVPTGKRALLIGDAPVFDLDVPVLYSTCFDDCLFEQVCRGRSVAAVRQQLVRLGVSHVFVNWSEIRRYRATYGFTDYITPERLERCVADGLLRPVPVDGISTDDGAIFALNATDAAR